MTFLLLQKTFEKSSVFEKGSVKNLKTFSGNGFVKVN